MEQDDKKTEETEEEMTFKEYMENELKACEMIMGPWILRKKKIEEGLKLLKD